MSEPPLLVVHRRGGITWMPESQHSGAERGWRVFSDMGRGTPKGYCCPLRLDYHLGAAANPTGRRWWRSATPTQADVA